MFNISKYMTAVISLLVFSSGSFYAYCSDVNNDKNDKAALKRSKSFYSITRPIKQCRHDYEDTVLDEKGKREEDFVIETNSGSKASAATRKRSMEQFSITRPIKVRKLNVSDRASNFDGKKEVLAYENSLFRIVPRDVKKILIESMFKAIFYTSQEEIKVGGKKYEKNPFLLARVCKDWNRIIKDFTLIRTDTEGNFILQPCSKLVHGITVDEEEMHRIFLSGKLVFKPNENNNDGMIEFPFSKTISSETIPFAETIGLIDISQCDDYVGGDISFTLNVHDFFDLYPLYTNEIMILIASRLMIKLEWPYLRPKVKDTFKNILEEWADDSMGIFWRWSGTEDLTEFDYAVNDHISDTSSRTLFKNWNGDYTYWADKFNGNDGLYGKDGPRDFDNCYLTKLFMCTFVNPKSRIAE